MGNPIQITPSGGGGNRKIAVSQVDDGADTIDRQQFVIASPTSAERIVEPTEAGELPVSMTDVLVAILHKLEHIANPINVDPVTGRQRIALESIAGSLTLATVTTVTTVATVTTLNQVAGIPANSAVYDIMQTAWDVGPRRCIT